MSWYILFLVKIKGRRRLFYRGCKKAGHIVRLAPRAIGCYRIREMNKVSPFEKFEIIPPLLCWLLDPLTKKYSWAWSSMINLGIDSRKIILKSSEGGGRSSNYLELQRESIKFFMVFFHKILKLIFYKQLSCFKNRYAEH